MQENAGQNLFRQIIRNQYGGIFQLDLKTGLITEYCVESMKILRTLPYDEWFNQIVSCLSFIEIQPFVNQMNLTSVQSSLNGGDSCYSVYYRVVENGRSRHYYLTFSYSDERKQALLITKQENTSYMQKQHEKMMELQMDSERFRFIISHLCENFGEINVKTGETWMTSLNDWEVEKGNLKDQIAWFAENLIDPEQKEDYIQDFELNHFVETLRKNGGFYAPTYAAVYPDGKHYLLIINALLSNPLNPAEEYIFGFVQDITKMKQEEEKNKRLIDISRQLLELSQTDSMTELYNRAAGEAKIAELLATKSGGALLLIDVDYFKRFNDNYGHMAGDTVLKYLASIMKNVFHSSDILCRWGGDEFLVYLQNADGAEMVEAQIRQLQENAKKHRYKSTALPITLSIGCAISASERGLKKLFARADELLYEVKQSGRNGYLIASL